MAQSLDNLSRTWSDAGTTFTAVKYNITDSGSAAGSLLMDLQVGGASKFKVDKLGGVTSVVATYNGVYIGSTAQNIGWPTSPSWGGVQALNMYSGSATTGFIQWNADLYIYRDAANTLAQRNGANAQAFRIYNTFTDASNHERGTIEWSSNVLRIGTEKAGSGTARALELQTDGTTRLTISTTGFATFSGNIRVDGYIDAKSTIFVLNRVELTAPALGVFVVKTNDAADFGRMAFGGSTSAFPALKRDTVRLQARLADDSAFTNIQGKLTTEANAVAETPTATHTLTIYDAAGTAYKVLAVAA